MFPIILADVLYTGDTFLANIVLKEDLSLHILLGSNERNTLTTNSCERDHMGGNHLPRYSTHPLHSFF